nr:Rieske 2Fe-2S domain-containing protein [Bradyrhizobium japonicum]
MTTTQRDRDLGTAYAMKPPHTRTELTSVVRGTPMGELLRRYWHPVGLTSDATDTPKKVRALGEDLILFRDKHGRVGLLHARCCHRGTTLYYGKVEEDGILLSRLEVRHRRPLPGATLRARRRPVQGQGAPALVSGRRALRADLRLYGSGRETPGAAGLRMPGDDGRRRVRRS